MIKGVKITNSFGIKKLDIDFKIKSHQGNNDIEEQIIDLDGKPYSLVPSFLAKNASGKTSIIKSIEFVSRFLNKDNFVKELKHYITTIFIKFSDGRYENLESLMSDNQSKIRMIEMIDWCIKSILSEIVHVGENHTKIQLELDEDIVAFELSEYDLQIKYDTTNFTFSLKHFLEETMIKINWNSIRSFMDFTIEVDNKMQHILSSYKFLQKNNFNFSYIDQVRASENHKKKYEFWSNIKTFINNFGFDSFQFLIKKIDKNITKIEFDEPSQEVMFYTKTSNGLPLNYLKLSFGTFKLVELISKSVVVLKKGGALLIDEIENGLHISLIKLLVEIYSDPEINVAKGQLIITTHNPLIFEKNIISPRNVFMTDADDIVWIKELSNYSRPSDTEAFVKSKNYYNDSFWEPSLGHDTSKSTLPLFTINALVHKLGEGYKTHGKEN